ncbi:MAG: hypothetical protein AYK19_21145 [Theionarchaea archaeon DG-70-1]|nr:MAG: hypothetical protein AYK19_21145 [Theionarchaea archaeon DG-70-1]
MANHSQILRVLPEKWVQHAIKSTLRESPFHLGPKFVRNAKNSYLCMLIIAANVGVRFNFSCGGKRHGRNILNVF